jgi:2-hydroxychromene-2-carboxylate isomerase
MSAALPTVEIWFDLASMYSYLSVMRIEELAASAGVQVQWEPFLLGPIFESFGWNSSPFILQKEKGEYMWKDLPRQCRKYGLPWKRPSVFPRNTVLPVRVALHGAHQSWGPAFAKEMMLRNWERDEDISGEASVRSALESVGLPAASVLAEAQAPQNKPRLRAQVERARGKKIFGAPTFFVRGEMFWGNDRLEDALEAARP